MSSNPFLFKSYFFDIIYLKAGEKYNFKIEGDRYIQISVAQDIVDDVWVKIKDAPKKLNLRVFRQLDFTEPVDYIEFETDTLTQDVYIFLGRRVLFRRHFFEVEQLNVPTTITVSNLKDPHPVDVTNPEMSNLSSLDVALSTRASESTLLALKSVEELSKDLLDKVKGILYDYATRKSGGRLLAIIDWQEDELGLGYVYLSGNIDNYVVTTYSEEGIPKPEGDGSDYVLKITIPAGGTAYISVPIKARFFKPYSAYITLYSKGYSVNVSPYITLGGYLTAYRNKLPRYLRLPSDTWGRFMCHWFMEGHHGTATLVIELNNPNSVAVDVYVGFVSAGEISTQIKGFCMLFGWEDVFELDVSNETLNIYVEIMLPCCAEVAHVYTSTQIVGDGVNTASASITLEPGGVVLTNGSGTGTVYLSKDFKFYFARRGAYPHWTMRFTFSYSTAGTATVNRLVVGVNAFTQEYQYEKYISSSVSGGTTATIIDFSSDVKHIKKVCISATAPTDGSLDILADTPEGEIVICSIPAGSTEERVLEGRYTYLKIRNNGSSSANYRAKLLISDSYLPR